MVTVDSKAHARLTALIGSLHTAVLCEDEARRIFLVNQAFCDMFSIAAPPEAMIGVDCSNAAEESKEAFVDPDSFVSRIETLLDEKEKVIGDVLDLRDGRHLERDYIPVWVDDEYVGHLWSYRDVSESVRAQRHTIQENKELARMQLELAERSAELERLNENLEREVVARTRELDKQRSTSLRSDRLRALGEMAAGIAHELSQPLLGVRGPAEHLALSAERNWNLDRERVSENARRIVEQADRMAHIIEHIRLFSREAGSPDTRHVDVREVVQMALDLTTAQLGEHGIRIRYDPPQSVRLVEANPYSLEEVVLNLLQNARDAVEALPSEQRDPPRCTIDLRVREESPSPREDRFVIIEIEDRGVGIPTEIVDRVFEAFFTTKPPDRGTGLGLSIARSITESFGGRLELRSRRGSGTVAIIALPALVPTPPPSRE